MAFIISLSKSNLTLKGAIMSRTTLDSNNIDKAALNFITQNHSEVVGEVTQAVSNNKVVLVGMGQNPVVVKAKKILEANKVDYTYLSYGNYFSKWKQRLAIKLWSGWPTYPQVFIDGKLIGGADDLALFLKR
jgi:glutaredoxin-related protein